MVLGTASSAGKSVISTALCRIFSDEGYKVCPFKAVNMSLNSVSLADGSEIARAQWLQSTAARVEPLREMNPVLLKPEGSGFSQVILLGKSRGVMKIADYQAYLMSHGTDAVDRSVSSLMEEFDVIIAEGAGSPAEINLMDDDIANTYVLTKYATRSILVGDIDRGGVFASLYGTVKLMRNGEKVSGFIINKMRGDAGMLKTGIEKLTQMTSKTVLGIMPYIEQLSLPGEDSLDYSNEKIPGKSIVVIKYPYMENYSDIDPVFAYGDGVRFLTGPDREVIEEATLIILPGSKNVREDLMFLKSTGLIESIISAAKGGKKILGICGGYQMLGKQIRFTDGTVMEGIGLLNAVTVYKEEKTVRKVQFNGFGDHPGENIHGTGYEIHYGSVYSDENPLFTTSEGSDGAVSSTYGVYGTNIHGILENSDVYRLFTGKMPNRSYGKILEDNISLLSETFKRNIDVEKIISWFT
ncbi:MAG: cobyric acid synthase [Thermoplasmata archaeon]